MRFFFFLQEVFLIFQQIIVLIYFPLHISYLVICWYLHIGSIRSTLVLFGPLCLLWFYLVQFSLHCFYSVHPIHFDLLQSYSGHSVQFGLVQSIMSTSVLFDHIYLYLYIYIYIYIWLRPEGNPTTTYKHCIY